MARQCEPPSVGRQDRSQSTVGPDSKGEVVSMLSRVSRLRSHFEDCLQWVLSWGGGSVDSPRLLGYPGAMVWSRARLRRSGPVQGFGALRAPDLLAVAGVCGGLRLASVRRCS